MRATTSLYFSHFVVEQRNELATDAAFGGIRYTCAHSLRCLLRDQPVTLSSFEERSTTGHMPRVQEMKRCRAPPIIHGAAPCSG